MPPPAIEARKSNAQSGSLKATLLLPPAAGAADNDAQLAVPERRIDIEEIPAPVPLTTVKLPACPNAGAGARQRTTKSGARSRLFMLAIYAENQVNPRRWPDSSTVNQSLWILTLC